MKRACELAPSRKEVKTLARRMHEQGQMATDNTPTPAPSHLEKLPTEIIQYIFFEALETDLANTCSTINQILSQEWVYRSLILFAYFDDDGEHPVETKHFQPAHFRGLSLDDRLRLQVGILKCRWCTLKRIKSCMPILSRLTMVQAWHRERTFEQKTFAELLRGDRVPKNIIRVPNGELLNIAPLPNLDEDSAMEQHFSAKKFSDFYFRYEAQAKPTEPTSNDGFLAFIQCWDYSPLVRDNPDGLVHKTVGHATATLGVMVIPDKLLEGNPWTGESIELLRLLRQGLRYKRHSEYLIIRSSAMVKGMENAITAGRVDVLTILVELHERVAGLYEDAPDLDKNYDRLLTSERNTNSSLNALPLHLFHSATQQGIVSSMLLLLLIRASWRSINLDDPILTGWALRAEARGNVVGKWLRNYMEGAYIQEFQHRPVFINGGISWRLREADSPFPERSFTDEAGYVHDHAPDKPMRRWPG